MEGGGQLVAWGSLQPPRNSSARLGFPGWSTSRRVPRGWDSGDPGGEVGGQPGPEVAGELPRGVAARPGWWGGGGGGWPGGGDLFFVFVFF